MATFLGVIEIFTKLGFYDYIFPFILIFAITYGLLSTGKPFGDDQRVNLIVALVLGFLFISFSRAVAFMNMFLPILTVFLIVLLFLMMAFKFAGAPSESIIATLKHPAGYGILLAIFLILITTTMTYTQPGISEYLTPINESELSPEGFALTPEAQIKQTMQTLFHPSIIGIIIMLIMFAATVYMVTHRK